MVWLHSEVSPCEDTGFQITGILLRVLADFLHKHTSLWSETQRNISLRFTVCAGRLGGHPTAVKASAVKFTSPLKSAGVNLFVAFRELLTFASPAVFDSDGPDCSAPSPKALETSRSREKISLFRSRRFRSVLIRLP